MTQVQNDESTRPETIPAGRYTAIAVQDTGIGMSSQVMAQAFEPFFTTKPMGKGTGLGLSMVYGFVRQSGGYVRLSSTPGQGTTVQLLFPLVEATAIAAPLPDSRGLVNTARNRYRILVVEDIEEVLATVNGMLTALGYDTATAVDGPSALRILSEQGPFDGMLTDIGLPGNLSGWELADLVGQTMPNLKIATMSGYNEQQVIGGNRINRQMPHLRKPFQRADLAKVMAALFPSDSFSRS